MLGCGATAAALPWQASAALLGAVSLEGLTLSEWDESATAPVRTLQLTLSMPLDDIASRGSLLKERSWRKTTLASVFGGQQGGGMGGMGGVLGGMFGKQPRREVMYVAELLEVRADRPGPRDEEWTLARSPPHGGAAMAWALVARARAFHAG